jgi:hypothetical protein
MKAISLLLLILACSHKDRPLQERQLIQCYLESDTYTAKKPFDAKMSVNVSEMGTILSAKVVDASVKDPNLNSCLSYVMMGAGRPLNVEGKSGPMEKNLKFRPDGKHEL